MSRTTMLLFVVLAMVLGACNQEGGGGTPGAAGPAAAAASASGGEIGVAECDEWLKKVEACMAKDPAMKTLYEPGYKMVRVSWKEQYAAGGASKAALKGSCQLSLDTLDRKCR